MRTTLLTSTCLLTLLAAPAHAETIINAATTQPILTGTANAGAADDVKISATGSIKPTSGTAVTINTNNSVVNDGTLQLTGVNGSRGISAQSGLSGNITNSATGKIILDENHTPADADNDGDLDGPFAIGTNRVGIETLGSFTGNITNNGQIQIAGNDSVGIRAADGLNGNVIQNGSVNVLGDNAIGVSLGDVTGNVRLAGTIAATGVTASAAILAGDINGALEIQGNIASSGYRYPTPPADTSKLDADDLLQGGPALSIEGNVTGGIILAVPPRNADANNNDEDADGIDDAAEGSALVRSFGSAPAMRIGHASDAINIGTVGTSPGAMGIVINGTVAGNGVYASVSATGLQIGGTGGAVTIDGGLGVAGSVNAVSRDAAATAIQIGSGASVATIRNSGRIEAVTGENGTARAIHDQSGSVMLVENSGLISASGALATSDRNVAIDLSANPNGAVIRQTAVAAGATAPRIVGDIRFGSGSDTLDIADGIVIGNSSFGLGNNSLILSGDAVYDGNVRFGSGNDSVNLAGTSIFVGDVDFGGGNDVLTLGGNALFSGGLINSSGLAANIGGGIFDLKGSAEIASLAVTGGGALAVRLGGPDETALNILGNANFAAGSKLILQLSNIQDSEGQHLIVTAGSITGAANLATNSDFLPFLYNGIVSHTATEIRVNLARKSAADMGLNRSEAGAFNAVINAAVADSAVEDTILGIRTRDGFRTALGMLLPEHEGGVFETVTSGSRALSRWLTDPTAPYRDEGKWGWFINQTVWGASKKIGDTAGYDVTGWGINIGGEIKTGVGNFGGALAYLGGNNGNAANSNEVVSHQWEGALHWRFASNGFNAHARLSGAPVSFTGIRSFIIATPTGGRERAMRGEWDGQLYSASGGLSYDRSAGRFTIRPAIAVDYYKLSEDAYQETGGGKALDLAVLSRDSDELAVNGTLALGLKFGGRDAYAGFTRIELEGGRRQIVSGDLGATTASFDGGTAFTLTPDQRSSGWIGRLRGVAGNSSFQFGGELSAEEQQGHTAWSVRASLRLGL